MGAEQFARLDFAAATPSNASVRDADAVLTIRKWTQAGAGAAPRVHSTRLARYQDPFVGVRLVWVVEVAGLNLPNISPSEHPSPPITRAVFLVSATEPELVVAMYSADD